MSLEPRTFYTILCDRCKADAFADDDCTVWDDSGDERVVRP